MQTSPVRKVSVLVLLSVHKDGQSLTRQLPIFSQRVKPNEQALLQELCFGCMRWRVQLEAIQAMLIEKPLRNKDKDISLLVSLGLYQLLHMRIPEHAVVQETVKITASLNKRWAKGMVNAVLRRFIRDKDAILSTLKTSDAYQYSHPSWILNKLQSDWPANWQEIAQENNQRPPMALRVNQQKQSRDEYCQMLEEAGIKASVCSLTESAILLDKPTGVDELPRFFDGAVSVQDAGAQLAAEILNPEPNETILDACAAPGGKTGHLLEKEKSIDLLALDVEPSRCDRIHENLNRLGLTAKVAAVDALDTASWWDGNVFDAILLDVPCSALGVIRRHPDIKSLRREDDISALVSLQSSILNAVWELLKPGGRLLYCTCSVLREENSAQVESFLAQKNDAKMIEIDATWGHKEPFGRQLLPGKEHSDGFFYSLLHKQ